ncbi:MAG: AMP-binding enzyme [Desertimonas sp.]
MSSTTTTPGDLRRFPEEVEEAVKPVDGVLDCRVVGIDDERFGQTVTVVVSRSGAVTERDIIASVKAELAGYNLAPRAIAFVETVPRAPNGTADHAAARALAAEAIGLGA